MIIDLHTHTFPDKVAGYALRGMEKEIVIKRGFEYHIKVDGTVDALSASTISAGLDLSVVLPVATKASQTTGINRFACMTNLHWKEKRVLSLGAIHPDNEDYKAILQGIKASGLRGIKLHPDYQGVRFDDIRYLRILDYAERLGLMVVVHAGEDFGLPESMNCTPDMIVRVLAQVQPSKLVLAHMGGLNMWDEVSEKLIGREVFLDTAFVLEQLPPHLTKERFVSMVRAHGARRVLFGTDSPWADQEAALDRIKNMDFSEHEKRLILGDNAGKLLGLYS